jgi:hypothetical protein
VTQLYSYISISQLRGKTSIQVFLSMKIIYIKTWSYKYTDIPQLRRIYVYRHIQTRHHFNHMQSSRIEIYLCSFPLRLIGILIRLAWNHFPNQATHLHAIHGLILFSCFFAYKASTPRLVSEVRSINSLALLSLKSAASTLWSYCLWYQEHQLFGLIVSVARSINSLALHLLYPWGINPRACSVFMISLC